MKQNVDYLASLPAITALQIHGDREMVSTDTPGNPNTLCCLAPEMKT